MNRIVLFDTSQGSLNLGDYIINNSIRKEMGKILKGNFVVKFPTHTPIIHSYQKNTPPAKYLSSSDLKFICGTNILKNSMRTRWSDWNVNIFNYFPYKDSILIGCGTAGCMDKVNLYTRQLYKKILSKKYYHSVRDEKTKHFVEALGFKAINTGCPTMWCLTTSHCAAIPKEKAKNVVFTITDYCKDVAKDRKLIKTLRDNYDELYFWVQGSGDYEYLKSISDISDINIIFSLEEYEELLRCKEIDYVGTRLHAGICAMQNKRRSIIITVDNRARDMKETYNLVTIERDDIDDLSRVVNSSFETEIKINEAGIRKWKAQFD